MPVQVESNLYYKSPDRLRMCNQFVVLGDLLESEPDAVTAREFVQYLVA